MSLADDLYEKLYPLQAGDDQRGYPLRALVRAVMAGFAVVEALTAETDDVPAWGATFDPDLAPQSALGYLGQFHGVSLSGLASETEQRNAVKDARGFSRGSVAAIKAAAAVHLTSTQRVDVFERVGDAWHITVATYVPQTPDPAVVEAAVRAAKPAGLLLTYECREGQAYIQIVAPRYASYTALAAAYADYDALRRDQPV